MNLSTAKSQVYFKFNSKGIILKIIFLFLPAHGIHITVFSTVILLYMLLCIFYHVWITAF